MVCILPTQMMLQNACSHAGGRKRHCLPQINKKKKYKSFHKSSFFVLMDSFLSQETLSHPLLVPILEDPKMELKTFLLPLRLGLLTAFHQSNEVIFRSCASFFFLCTIDRLFLNDFGVCKGRLPVCFFPVFA